MIIPLLVVAAASVFGNPLATNQFSIYVPSTRSIDLPLDAVQHGQYVTGVARMLTELAGGSTITHAMGTWQSEHTRNVVVEPVTVVTAALHLTPAKAHELHQLAVWLRQDLAQEAVLVQIDGVSYLV